MKTLLDRHQGSLIKSKISYDSETSLQMIKSKLTSKAQTTIPQPVRAALRLKEGDELMYRIEDDRVILSNVLTGCEDPFRAFSEWDSVADRKAYGDL